LQSSLQDTIVARATAAGEGAIAIVRLSGPAARAIGASLTGSTFERASHRLWRATLRDEHGGPLDEGLVVQMRAPKSYTGEDVVEFHLHGARVVVEGVLAACCRAGARLAEPGEFTLRAFVNGRLDLAQAEAVADLVGAESELDRDIAAAHLKGSLSSTVTALVNSLEQVLAEWRASLDFPEQAGEAGVGEEQWRTLREIACTVQAMIANARIRLQRGRHVVLCGAPNVGKSSLLNAWVGEGRALVDEAPGTTRDPIEVGVLIGRERWSLWDTAGIRDRAEGIERKGQALALERAAAADLVLWLVAAPEVALPPASLRRAVVVGGKADRVGAEERRRLEEQVRTAGHEFWGWVSARTREGMEELRGRIGCQEALGVDAAHLVVRERQLQALQGAQEALERLLVGATEEAVLDILAYELEQALRCLGQILGRDVDEDVLERIFAQFCLGK
jgi:tRNA modification GTPase